MAAKDKLKGVWINGGAVSLPAPEQIFWGTMLRLPIDLAVGTNVDVAAAADTAGFFPADGGAVAALLRVTEAGRPRIDSIYDRCRLGVAQFLMTRTGRSPTSTITRGRRCGGIRKLIPGASTLGAAACHVGAP